MQTKNAPDVAEFLGGEKFVSAFAGHGDTICAVTDRGRIFVRKRDPRDTGPRPVMRWYEARSPDFTAEFEPYVG